MTLLSNWFDSSPCKGCEYGERVTSGVYCAMTQGLVPTGYPGCKVEHDYYEEVCRKEVGITLKELAQELRKIIAFDCITVHKNWCKSPLVLLWRGKPEYRSAQDIGGWVSDVDKSRPLGSLGVYSIIGGLSLSEYADENGEIDYSKCIVEVE